MVTNNKFISPNNKVTNNNWFSKDSIYKSCNKGYLVTNNNWFSNKG